eukprot:gnl/MRDRNA2_/MRDRNA2_81962_c0_seq1.p1 gnl/MRDRNA2_/MRDRNA2_81962_c0~~gnl/MRDRNA2_/MRDRNA2_81962_c0_seq1.p1  ORF type:complete len:181 (+),score=25.03 gnl/MRDRNA2_/MRDRNA2_81962_c0_seq1:116-658(+)
MITVTTVMLIVTPMTEELEASVVVMKLALMPLTAVTEELLASVVAAKARMSAATATLVTVILLLLLCANDAQDGASQIQMTSITAQAQTLIAKMLHSQTCVLLAMTLGMCYPLVQTLDVAPFQRLQTVAHNDPAHAECRPTAAHASQDFLRCWHLSYYYCCRLPALKLTCFSTSTLSQHH